MTCEATCQVTCEEPREPYEWDAVEIGMFVGHIAQLNNRTTRGRKKHPIGFAPPAKTRKRTPPQSAGRDNGTFPEVPYFDVGP